jgi:hypothetical protein
MGAKVGEYISRRAWIGDAWVQKDQWLVVSRPSAQGERLRGALSAARVWDTWPQ